MMEVYPAIDVLDGKCVQLVQGKRERATVYGTPLEWAWKWLDEGADALHIINLDGAFGNAVKNTAIIRELIRETGARVQLGGGIRSIEDAGGWLDLGVNRVILGTLAVQRPHSITELADTYGATSVMAGVDARGGEVVVKGWEESAGDYLTWARRFEELGAGSLLFTNVDVEGLQEGIDPEPVRRLIQEVHVPVIVAGGITRVDDVRELKAIKADGIVLGSALYSGKISIHDALEAVK
jgi:phosphoribosylformimino-5-aminoimidazole carboxamide ribotide isomerase